MKHVVAYPYLRPLAKRIQPDPWSLQTEDLIESPLEDMLPHWDYNTPIQIHRTVHIDLSGVRKDCSLTSEDALRAGVVWHSSGTTLRGSGSTVDLRAAAEHLTVPLSLEVEGSLLAGDITIRTQLVLARRGGVGRGLTPVSPGCVLWEEEKRVLLEGISARFPVEAIDFSKTLWTPAGAGWFLDWDSNDLHQRMLGGPRLYINSSHPKVIRAVTSPTPDAEHRAIADVIYFDVGQKLIRGALENEEFIRDPSVFQRGSVGAVIRNLIAATFPGNSPQGLRNMMQERTTMFDCHLQDRLRLFRGR